MSRNSWSFRLAKIIVLSTTVVAVVLSASSHILAQTLWTQSSGGKWAAPSNWNPANVPDTAAESAEVNPPPQAKKKSHSIQRRASTSSQELKISRNFQWLLRGSF